MEFKNKSRWLAIGLLLVLLATISYQAIHWYVDSLHHSDTSAPAISPDAKRSTNKKIEPQYNSFTQEDKSISDNGQPITDSSSEEEMYELEDEEANGFNQVWWEGNVYTPMGAQRAGSEDLSIPRWTGSINGVPSRLKNKVEDNPYADPYSHEKPIVKLTNDNYQDYKNELSEGLITLFERYPYTFSMSIYPSHRDFLYNSSVLEQTFNAYDQDEKVSRVQLGETSDDIQGYVSGVPFVFPKNAVEVMWNAKLAQFYPSLEGVLDAVAVFANGQMNLSSEKRIAKYPFSPSLVEANQFDRLVYQSLSLNTVLEPKRQSGQITLTREPINIVNTTRDAYIYSPNINRIRRAPNLNYDMPAYQGGLMAQDDKMGFSGSLSKFDWTLIGKKPLYIPYHNYQFDHPLKSYQDLLEQYHPNPEYMRYEKHRVWVIEAHLKSDERHVYAKRRFYIDEDTWQIVLTESYDDQDRLLRVGILNTLYDYVSKLYIARAQVFFDLESRSYIATRLVNLEGHPKLNGEAKKDVFFTPQNLRKISR